jgi:hypothetical protein
MSRQGALWCERAGRLRQRANAKDPIRDIQVLCRMNRAALLRARFIAVCCGTALPN